MGNDQKEALKRLDGYEIVETHSDGDLTVKSDDTLYVVTTEGDTFRQIGDGERLTQQEITEIAQKTASEVLARTPSTLIVHIMEHEVIGGGWVIDEAKARATGCRCFDFEGEEYCWSQGVLGLISSKKNPEQLKEFCALGKEPAGAGAQKRFTEIKGAVSEAHEEWKKEDSGLPGWWSKVGDKLEEKGVEL